MTTMFTGDNSWHKPKIVDLKEQIAKILKDTCRENGGGDSNVCIKCPESRCNYIDDKTQQILDLMKQGVMVDCPECDGKKFISDTNVNLTNVSEHTGEYQESCPTCKGTGKVKLEVKRVALSNIPPSISVDKYWIYAQGFHDGRENQLTADKEVQAQINAANLKEIEKLKAEKKEMIKEMMEDLKPLVRQLKKIEVELKEPLLNKNTEGIGNDNNVHR